MVTLSEFAVECLQQIGTYVLLRGADGLETLHRGQDLDILVADLAVAEEGICAEFDRLMADDFDLEITWLKDRVHIDLLSDQELILRFDLIEDFSSFSKLSIRPAFKIDLFIRRSEMRIHRRPVFLPSTMDDLIMRYFEFMEYFDTRPDKIKHLDFIVEKLEEVSRERFFDATHRYVGFPTESWEEKARESREDKPVRVALRDVLQAIMNFAFSVRRSAATRLKLWIGRLGNGRRY